MIVFALHCSQGHEFEAWFRDSASFEAQCDAGEIACPDCADTAIEKAPMAPRVARARAAQIPAPDKMRAALRELRQHVEKNCDYVGERFAEEARRIHYGESDPRGIYGEASDAESRELADEGIEFGRIPWVPASDS